MALTTIVAGAGLGLGAVQSFSTMQQGQFANQMARRQAQLMTQQSKYVQQQAGMKMASDDYNAIQLLSRIRVGAAASGADPGEGSARDLTEVSAHHARLQDMFTKYS